MNDISTLSCNGFYLFFLVYVVFLHGLALGIHNGSVRAAHLALGRRQ